jgi:hypothetical protein
MFATDRIGPPALNPGRYQSMNTSILGLFSKDSITDLVLAHPAFKYRTQPHVYPPYLTVALLEAMPALH